ncbi:uncharacterized protein MELLADRAFT_61144 [Melampsora larici-populina 98AG31]|uniref:Uncharacterized protein n=1 Tax=Melampsora larici-populina (strain 98AG31 / pathotype 3-4-7) TaxID=747676 RepID=F4RDS5_MELLP|nr:uncharacterized protein MELLADRAFT_61144 [Melampsora larici-populina 98AG31]EGG09557.1 hypothetical protein MELLADRAFT_61144 [Melampsora larici-populina 98AG31]
MPPKDQSSSIPSSYQDSRLYYNQRQDPMFTNDTTSYRDHDPYNQHLMNTDNPLSHAATLSPFHHPTSTLENKTGSEDDAEGETDDEEKGKDESDFTEDEETGYDESEEEQDKWMDSNRVDPVIVPQIPVMAETM